MSYYSSLNIKCDSNCMTCYILDLAVRNHGEDKKSRNLGNPPNKFFQTMFQIINNAIWHALKMSTEGQNIPHTEMNSADSTFQSAAETLQPESSTIPTMEASQSNAAESSKVPSQLQYLSEVLTAVDITSNTSAASSLQLKSYLDGTIVDTLWQPAVEENTHTVICLESPQFDSSTASTDTVVRSVETTTATSRQTPQDLETNASLQPPVPATQVNNSVASQLILGDVNRIIINTESSMLDSPRESVQAVVQNISKSPLIENIERINEGSYFISHSIVQPSHAGSCFPPSILSSTMNNSPSNILQISPIDKIAHNNNGQNITDQQENGLCSEMEQVSGLNDKNYDSQHNENFVEGITNNSVAEKIDDATDKEIFTDHAVPSLIVSLGINSLDCPAENTIDRDDICHICDAVDRDNINIDMSGKPLTLVKINKAGTINKNDKKRKRGQSNKNSKSDCNQKRKNKKKSKLKCTTAKGSADKCSNMNNQLDCSAIYEVKTKNISDINEHEKTPNIGCKNKFVTPDKKSLKKQYSNVPKVVFNKIQLRSHTKKMSDLPQSATQKPPKTTVKTNTDDKLQMKKKITQDAKTKNTKLKQASMKIETYKKLFGIDDELSQLMAIASPQNKKHKSVIINPVHENTSRQLIDATLSIRKTKPTEDITIPHKKPKLTDKSTDIKSNQHLIEKHRLTKRILNYESLMRSPEIFQKAFVNIERLKSDPEISDASQDSTSTNKRKRFISSSDESTGHSKGIAKKRKLTGNGKKGRKISMQTAIKLFAQKKTSFEQSDPEESSAPDDIDADKVFREKSDKIFISDAELKCDQPAKEYDGISPIPLCVEHKLLHDVSDTEINGDQSTIGLENSNRSNEQPAIQPIDINTYTGIDTDDIAQQNIFSQPDVPGLKAKPKDENEHKKSPESVPKSNIGYSRAASQSAVRDKSNTCNDSFKTLIDDNANSTSAEKRLIPKTFANIHHNNIFLSKENKLILYQFNRQRLRYVDTNTSFTLLRVPLDLPNIYLYNFTPKLLLNSTLINTSLRDLNYLFKNNTLSVTDEKGIVKVKTPWTLTFSGNTINISESFLINRDVQSQHISCIEARNEDSNRLKAQKCPRLGPTLEESNLPSENSQDCVIIESENKEDIILIDDNTSPPSEAMIDADSMLLPKLEPVQFIEPLLNTVQDNNSLQNDIYVPIHYGSTRESLINTSNSVTADSAMFYSDTSNDDRVMNSSNTFLSTDVEDHIQDNVIDKSTMRVVQSKDFTSPGPDQISNSINQEVFDISSANKAIILSHLQYCLDKIKMQNVLTAALQSAPQNDVLDLSRSSHNSTLTADPVDTPVAMILNDWSEKSPIPIIVEKQSNRSVDKCTPDSLPKIEVDNSVTVDGINDADMKTNESPLGQVLLSKTVERLSDRINQKPVDTDLPQSLELNKNTTLTDSDNISFELASIKTEVTDNETNDDTLQIAPVINLTDVLSTDIESLTEGIFLEMRKHNWRRSNKKKTKTKNSSRKKNSLKLSINPSNSRTEVSIKVTPAEKKEHASKISSHLDENLSEKTPSKNASVISLIANKNDRNIMKNKKQQPNKQRKSINKLNSKESEIRAGISGVKAIKISEKILKKIDDTQYSQSQKSLAAENTVKPTTVSVSNDSQRNLLKKIDDNQYSQSQKSLVTENHENTVKPTPVSVSNDSQRNLLKKIGDNQYSRTQKSLAAENHENTVKPTTVSVSNDSQRNLLKKIGDNQYSQSQKSLVTENHENTVKLTTVSVSNDSERNLMKSHNENIGLNTITNNTQLPMTPLKLSRIPGSIRSYRIEKKLGVKSIFDILEDKSPSVERLNYDNEGCEGSFNRNCSVDTDQQTSDTRVIEQASETSSSILSTRSSNNCFKNTFHEVDIDIQAEKNKNSSTVSTVPEFKSRILEDIVLVSAKTITPRCETPRVYSNTSHHLVRSIAQKNRSHKAMPLVNPDERQPSVSQRLPGTIPRKLNIITCNSKPAPLENNEIEIIRAALPNTNISISTSSADTLHSANIICNPTLRDPRSDNSTKTNYVSQNPKALTVVPDISVGISPKEQNIKTHIFQPPLQRAAISKRSQTAPLQHRFPIKNLAGSKNIQTSDSIRNQEYLAYNIVPEQVGETMFRSPSPHRCPNELLAHSQTVQHPQFNDESFYHRPPPQISQNIYGNTNLPQCPNGMNQQMYFNPNYALQSHQNRPYVMKTPNLNSTIPIRQSLPYPGYGGRPRFESPPAYTTPNRPYYHPYNSTNRNIHPHYPNHPPGYPNYHHPPPPL